MAEFSEKITEVSDVQTLDELRDKLQENLDMIQRFIDGITGQRLEPWTAVLRDGSVEMTGDLVIDSAGITMKRGYEESGLRLLDTGVMESKSASSSWRPVRDQREREDVTDDRALNTIFTNASNKEIEVYIQVQIGGS